VAAVAQRGLVKRGHRFAAGRGEGDVETRAGCGDRGIAALDGELVFAVANAVADLAIARPDAPAAERAERRVIKRRGTGEVRDGEGKMVEQVNPLPGPPPRGRETIISRSAASSP
jgi:hypothetical protein